MSSQQQIEANRENSQHSTGPTSPEGKQRSSLNATVHGFTGLNLVVSPSEKEPYEAFVKAILLEFRPGSAEARELLQNYTDLRWSLQQITVQQNSIVSIMNAITAQFIESGDMEGMNAALEPHTRRLKTLGTYEQRRRRAAKETLEQFNTVEREHYEARQEDLESAAQAHIAFKKLGQSWDPMEFGFAHSLPQIEQFLATKENAQMLQMIRREADQAAMRA